MHIIGPWCRDEVTEKKPCHGKCSHADGMSSKDIVITWNEDVGCVQLLPVNWDSLKRDFLLIDI